MKHPHNAWSYLQQQAQLTPDKAAIIDEKDDVVTFESFLSACENAAAMLHREGIDQTSRVALNAESSRNCLIAAFALIRCGAIMVPIDLRFPRLAVEKMVESAGCTHIITKGTAPDGVRTIPLDFSGPPASKPPDPTPRQLPQEGLVLFTSGSTGEPKGVSIESSFFLERFNGHNTDLTGRTLSLFKGSITWICVIPVVEVCRGDTVLIMPYDTLIDPQAFLQRLIRYDVTEFGTVPSHLRLLTPYHKLLAHMKRVCVWGEFITDDLIETMRREYPEVELFDIYSATESLGYGAIRRLSGTEYNFASGWQADGGYGMHVLDENNQAAAIGERGEVAFSGDAIAAGYLNNPELTAKKFFDNPFGPGRLYRTGDLGTLMEDGTITLHGREDAQVQIRGIRIELTEIESAAAQFPAVNAAAAFVIADEDDASSIGLYVTPEAVDIDALRGHLSGHLSTYAMPSYLAAVDELPRTSSGKLNHKELRRGLSRRAPAEAMDELQAYVVAIYSELLGTPQVHPDDDFYELGGHSLLLAKLLTQISAQLNVDIAPLDATQNGSPRKLSALIKSRQELGESVTESVEIPTEVPLPKEAVLWFGYKSDLRPDVEEAKRDMYVTEYLGGHITYAFVDLPACIGSQEELERALTHLFARHPILRSRVPDERPVTRLRIKPFSLDDYLVNGYGGWLDEDDRLQVYRDLSQFFDVPLVKMYVQNKTLHFAFHHILSDHTSMNIAKRDFVAIAEAFADEREQASALDYSLIAKCVAFENSVGEVRHGASQWSLPAEPIEGGKHHNMGYRFEIVQELLGDLNDGDVLPFALAATIGALHEATGQVEGNLQMVLDFRSLTIMPHNVTNHIGYLSFVKPVYLTHHGATATRVTDVLNHYRAALETGKNETPLHTDGDGVVFNYMESVVPADRRFETVTQAFRVEENPVCTVYDFGPGVPWKGVWIDVTHDTDDRGLVFAVYTSSGRYSNESVISFGALLKKHLSPDSILSSGRVTGAEGTERRIRGIFSELLDVPRVGADDDFFHLGGHSLLLWKLVTTLNTVFRIQIAPSDAARHSTPGKLASFIRQSGAAATPASVAVPTELRLPGEAAIWFGYRIDPPKDPEEIQRWIYAARHLFGHVIYKSFDMPRTITSQERLAQVLTQLFKRHPILCAQIPQQVTPRHMKVARFALGDYQANEYGEPLTAETISGAYRELSTFYGVPLVKIYTNGQTIHFAIHHILSDQSSLRIIKKDFCDIAHALEHQQPVPQLLDYTLMEKYLPPEQAADSPTADLAPWRLDGDEDSGPHRAMLYRMDFPAVAIKHVQSRDLPSHAIRAIISAAHDLTGQTEGDLCVVVDRRAQDSTLDNIIDHIGYLSFIQPVRISHHGPTSADQTEILAHYRQALREGKRGQPRDADAFRIILNYIEDDEPLQSPVEEFSKYCPVDREKGCTVCDLGDAFGFKQAFMMITHHTLEHSLHIDLYTYHRSYSKQRMVHWCQLLHGHLTAGQSQSHDDPAQPAE